MSSLYEEIHEAPETTPVRRVSVSVNGEKRVADVELHLRRRAAWRIGVAATSATLTTTATTTTTMMP